jgi:hypothetical protein
MEVGGRALHVLWAHVLDTVSAACLGVGRENDHPVNGLMM